MEKSKIQFRHRLSAIWGILFSGINRWISIISIGIIGTFLVWHLSVGNYSIFPLNNSFSYHFYNDSANGGNSTILATYKTDSVLGLDFKLNNGFYTPYIGINFKPSLINCIDISDYNQMELEVKSQNMESMAVYLFTINTINGKQKETCFFKTIQFINKKNRYHLNLNEFEIPDWWFATNNIVPDKHLKPDLQNLAYINIGSTYTTDLETIRTLKIYSLSFGNNNQQFILFAILVLLLELSVLLAVHYFGRYLQQIKQQHTISYKPIEVTNSNQPGERFIAYINDNFSNQALSLELVARETGVHPKFITNNFQLKYGLNFKTYLNQLRIAESKRLLIETNLSIGEVAFKVGFNNQSHFNRVFKSIEGKNPSEFKAEKG